MGVSYCDTHKPKRTRKPHRVRSNLRGFDGEYKRNRVKVLATSRVCVLCGGEGAQSVDHINPRSRGIDNTLNNLAPAHLSCNAARRDKPLTRAQVQRVRAFQRLLTLHL